METADTDRSGRRGAYLLLAAVILLWGANWPVMKVGLESITPFWFAASRALMGAACLFAVLLWQGRFRLPPRRDLPVVVSIGLFQIAVALALIHFGLKFVDAGRSAILAYTFPLWVAPLAVVLLGEHLSRAKIGGLALGLGGIAVMFSPTAVDFTDPDSLLGNGLLLLASLNWAVAVVHIRGHTWEAAPIQLMPWQLLLGGVILVAIAAAFEGAPAPDWSPGLIAVLAYNGPIASAFCFWAYVTVAKRLPAMSTALGSLGVPVTGALTSAWFLGDDLGLHKISGLALISLGVVLVTVVDLQRSKQGAKEPA